MSSIHNYQPGYLIVYAIILMFGLMSIGLTVLTIASATYTYSKDDVHRQNAAYMAKACVSVIANELNENSDFSGFSPAAKPLFDRTDDGGGKSTCKVDSITDGDGNQKIVKLTSTIYRGDSDTSPVEYQAQALLDSAGDVGDTDYLMGGILVGHGGMNLTGSGELTTSRVNILGTLYKRGSRDYTVEGGHGPLNIYNIACETNELSEPSNWPQPCTDTPPIDMGGTGEIAGNICAPGQPSHAKLISLNPNPACLQDPEITMPTFDKAGFIAGLTGPTINGSDVIGDGGCYRKSGSNYYGKTYHVPAGATVLGDINLSDLPELVYGNRCKVVFDGDAYITGAIAGNLNDNEKLADFTVDSGAPGDITIVMNRGMSLQNADNFTFTKGGGNLAHIINFNSSNTTCSDSDTVPSSTVSTCLTPAEAKLSATDVAYAGLFVGSSSGNKNLSGITMYAYYSRVDLNYNSGNFSIAAMAGQGLDDTGNGGNLSLTVDDPTFGIPIPSGGGYHTVDFFQR